MAEGIIRLHGQVFGGDAATIFGVALALDGRLVGSMAVGVGIAELHAAKDADIPGSVAVGGAADGGFGVIHFIATVNSHRLCGIQAAVVCHTQLRGLTGGNVGLGVIECQAGRVDGLGRCVHLCDGLVGAVGLDIDILLVHLDLCHIHRQDILRLHRGFGRGQIDLQPRRVLRYAAQGGGNVGGHGGLVFQRVLQLFQIEVHGAVFAVQGHMGGVGILSVGRAAQHNSGDDAHAAIGDIHVHGVLAGVSDPDAAKLVRGSAVGLLDLDLRFGSAVGDSHGGLGADDTAAAGDDLRVGLALQSGGDVQQIIHFIPVFGLRTAGGFVQGQREGRAHIGLADVLALHAAQCRGFGGSVQGDVAHAVNLIAALENCLVGGTVAGNGRVETRVDRACVGRDAGGLHVGFGTGGIDLYALAADEHVPVVVHLSGVFSVQVHIVYADAAGHAARRGGGHIGDACRLHGGAHLDTLGLYLHSAQLCVGFRVVEGQQGGAVQRGRAGGGGELPRGSAAGDVVFDVQPQAAVAVNALVAVRSALIGHVGIDGGSHGGDARAETRRDAAGGDAQQVGGGVGIGFGGDVDVVPALFQAVDLGGAVDGGLLVQAVAGDGHARVDAHAPRGGSGGDGARVDLRFGGDVDVVGFRAFVPEEADPRAVIHDGADLALGIGHGHAGADGHRPGARRECGGQRVIVIGDAPDVHAGDIADPAAHQGFGHVIGADHGHGHAYAHERSAHGEAHGADAPLAEVQLFREVLAHALLNGFVAGLRGGHVVVVSGAGGGAGDDVELMALHLDFAQRACRHVGAHHGHGHAGPDAGYARGAHGAAEQIGLGGLLGLHVDIALGGHLRAFGDDGDDAVLRLGHAHIRAHSLGVPEVGGLLGLHVFAALGVAAVLIIAVVEVGAAEAAHGIEALAAAHMDVGILRAVALEVGFEGIQLACVSGLTAVVLIVAGDLAGVEGLVALAALAVAVAELIGGVLAELGPGAEHQHRRADAGHARAAHSGGGVDHVALRLCMDVHALHVGLTGQLGLRVAAQHGHHGVHGHTGHASRAHGGAGGAELVIADRVHSELRSLDPLGDLRLLCHGGLSGILCHHDGRRAGDAGHAAARRAHGIGADILGRIGLDVDVIPGLEAHSRLVAGLGDGLALEVGHHGHGGHGRHAGTRQGHGGIHQLGPVVRNDIDIVGLDVVHGPGMDAALQDLDRRADFHSRHACASGADGQKLKVIRVIRLRADIHFHPDAAGFTDEGVHGFIGDHRHRRRADGGGT